MGIEYVENPANLERFPYQIRVSTFTPFSYASLCAQVRAGLRGCEEDCLKEGRRELVRFSCLGEDYAIEVERHTRETLVSLISQRIPKGKPLRIMKRLRKRCYGSEKQGIGIEAYCSFESLLGQRTREWKGVFAQEDLGGAG